MPAFDKVKGEARGESSLKVSNGRCSERYLSKSVVRRGVPGVPIAGLFIATAVMGVKPVKADLMRLRAVNGDLMGDSENWP
jgi:hypothetical protein